MGLLIWGSFKAQKQTSLSKVITHGPVQIFCWIQYYKAIYLAYLIGSPSNMQGGNLVFTENLSDAPSWIKYWKRDIVSKMFKMIDLESTGFMRSVRLANKPKLYYDLSDKL